MKKLFLFCCLTHAFFFGGCASSTSHQDIATRIALDLEFVAATIDTIEPFEIDGWKIDTIKITYRDKDRNLPQEYRIIATSKRYKASFKYRPTGSKNQEWSGFYESTSMIDSHVDLSNKQTPLPKPVSDLMKKLEIELPRQSIIYTLRS